MTGQLVNAETGEVVEAMTPAEAHEFVRFITVVQEQLPARVLDAYHRRAWIALGYESWAAMCEAEGLQLRLPREERQEFVLEVSAGGMSTRAAAAVLGVHHDTVAVDAKSGVGFPTPEPVPEPSPEPNGSPELQAGGSGDVAESAPPAEDPDSPDTEAIDAEIVDNEPEPKRTTGLDGKSYPKPSPKTPTRRPLTDAFVYAAHDLKKSVERIERLTQDDRFTRNAEQVATKHRSDLTRAVESLTKALDCFPS